MAQYATPPPFMIKAGFKQIFCSFYYPAEWDSVKNQIRQHIQLGSGSRSI